MDLPTFVLRRRNPVLPVLAAALLLVLAAPVSAQSPESCGSAAGFLGPASPESVIASVAVPVVQGGLGDPIAPATCTAQCGGGVTVTCTGTSCSAFDRGCPWQEGYCTSPSETKVCPEPCPCSVTKHCPDGTILSCSGFVPFCDGGEWACYVDCDWNPQYCPGHWGEETC